MPTWTVGQLCEATGGTLLAGGAQAPVNGLSLDSRRIQPREAFLAIRGARFDAHHFIPEAVTRGASCVIVSQSPGNGSEVPALLVKDTVQALGDIAAFHRRRFSVPVIAVTGSCGKTTTKELIAHLLSGSRSVVKTDGTQNNQIGLPLTLLGLRDEHEAAVVELGTNHPGEIAYLAGVARPTGAVITNVGPAHLEFFGSVQGILQEKLSLLDALPAGGWAVVPGDQLDVWLQARSRLRPGVGLVSFGTSQRCDVQGLDICRDGDGLSMQLRGVRGRFTIPLPGSHNLENALAALACMQAMGISLESVRERLAGFVSLPLRSQVIRRNGLTIVNDCYNANPLSFARALEILRDLDVRRRVLIAGDMLELGTFSQAAHRSVGRLAAEHDVDLLLAVGGFAPEMAQGAAEAAGVQTIVCQDLDHLKSMLGSVIREGDGVLIKGSRKLRLERASEWLLQVHVGRGDA
ncbi:MAG: UDP-N-acetylmuramoyl-tripeptide--D-alanyl-D-alanine ligase [Candidatus Omnitrophica bacterium]|nr:UDP-N-acetylmuramoyl-tripeptide--D-alanyl-D-alanine ligase [Candidatus Omnitrophota bacterium]